MTLYALIFAAAVVVGLGWTELVRRLAVRWGVMDQPSSRRIHTRPIPRLGGVAIYLTLWTIVGLLAWFDRLHLSQLLFANVYWLFLIALSASLVFAVGVIDDIVSLTPLQKLAVETFAACIFVAGTYAVQERILGIDVGLFGAALSIFWIIAVTNAFNLIDGLDGLCAGLALIVSLTVGWIALYSGNGQTAVLLAIFGGALTGFLRFNFHPSRIFLGDSGSLFIGFLLAVISLNASSRLSSALGILVPVLCLGLPLIETLLTATRRLLGGVQVRPVESDDEHYAFVVSRPTLFRADRNHIHHRLLDLGLSHRNAVLVLYGASVLFALGAFALVARQAPHHALLLTLFGIATLLGIRRLNYGEIQIFRNGTLLPLFDLPLVNRRLLHVIVDLLFIVGSYLLATWIAFDAKWPAEARFLFWQTLPLVALAQIVSFVGSGLYRGAYRYTGVSDLLVMTSAITLASVATWLIMFAWHDWRLPHLGMVMLDLYFLATLIVTSRLGFHILEFIFKRERHRGIRVLLYGAGATGLAALREIRRNPQHRMQPVGFLDHDPRKIFRSVDGVPIYACEKLEELIDRHSFDELIIATNRLPIERVIPIAERCELAGIPVRRFSIAWDRFSTAVPLQTLNEEAAASPSIAVADAG